MTDKNEKMSDFIERRRPENVTVSWYEHECDWITKYCDEHHRKYAVIPRSVLAEHDAGVTA